MNNISCQIKKPVLVTGAHRSGSTWVGKIIAAYPGLVYIHEPFNITMHQPGICSARFDHWFTYITDANESRFYKPLRKTVRLQYDLLAALRANPRPQFFEKEIREWIRFSRYRLHDMQPLLKDPIAVFSAEWMARSFEMQVIVLIRHPAAFVSSLMRKGWTYSFTHFLHQPLLMEEQLGLFKNEIAEYAARPPEIIDQACLLWRIIYHIVSKYQARHDDWIFLRHEDISRDPLRYFNLLFVELGLELTPDIETMIKEYSNSANPIESSLTNHELKLNSRANIWNWKQRLTSKEIVHIRQKVEDVSMKFYTSEDW